MQDSTSSFFIWNATSLTLVLLVPSADPKLVVVLLVISHEEEPGTLCGQNIKLGVLHCSWLFAMQMGGFVSHSAISMVTKWRQVCITSLVKCNPYPGTCAKEAYGVKGTAIYFLEMKATKATSAFFFSPPPLPVSVIAALTPPPSLSHLAFSGVPIVKN